MGSTILSPAAESSRALLCSDVGGTAAALCLRKHHGPAIRDSAFAGHHEEPHGVLNRAAQMPRVWSPFLELVN